MIKRIGIRRQWITALLVCLLFSCSACGVAQQSTAAPEENSSGEASSVTESTEPARPSESETEAIPLVQEPYCPAPFWLEAEDADLNSAEGGIIRLRAYVAAGTQAERISLYAGDEELLALSYANPSREEAAAARYGEIYDCLTLELEASRLVGDKIYLSLRDGESACTPVILYRPLLLSEEDWNLGYDVTYQLGEMAQAVLDKGEAIDGEALLLQAREQLRQNEAVTDIQRQGNTLYYTLKSGMTSYFSVEEEDGTFASGGSPKPESHTAESLPGAFYVGGSCDPEEYYVRDTSFRDAVINPNILVMAPVRTYENIWSGTILNVMDIGAANGNAEEELGKKLEALLEEGNMTLKTDDDCTAQLIRDWSQYGFVFMNCHGPDNNGLLHKDGRGSDVTYYHMVTKKWTFNGDHFDDFKDSLSAWEIAGDPAKQNYNKWVNNDLSFGIHIEYFDLLGTVDFSVTVSSDYMMLLLEDASFRNTVFLFDVCNGCTDTVFNQFLLDRGAAAVIGFQESVKGTFAQSFVSDLYDFFAGEESRSDTGFRSVPLTEQNLRWYYRAGDAGQAWQGKGSLLLRSFSDSAHIFKENDTELCLQGETTLRGEVRIASSGKLLENQKVDLYRWYNGSLRLFDSVNTDSGGSYTFWEVPFGCYMLHTVYKGENTILNLNVAGKGVIQNDLDIQLIRVDVVVVDQNDQPVEGAQVVLDHKTYGAETAALKTREDGTQAYRLEEKNADDGYTLSVSAEGYLPAEMQLALERDPLTAQYTVHLTKLGEFHAQVVEKESGDPLEGVKVLMKSDELIWSGLTAGDGTVFAKGLIAGEYTVSFEKAGYKTEKITVLIEYDTVTVLLYTIEMEKEDCWLLVAKDYQDIANRGLWSYYLEYFYDEEGRLIEIGDLSAAQEYEYHEYDDEGCLTMKIEGTSGSTWLARKYEYDAEGRIATIRNYTLDYEGVDSREDWKGKTLTDNGWEINYYEGDLLVKNDHYASDGSFLYGKVYEYDDEGRLLLDYEVDEEGNQRVSEYGKRYKTTYEYDEEGFLIEEVYYGSRIVTTQYEYTDGLLSKETNLYSGYVFYYHYDENGNLVEEDTYSGMGKTLTARTLYYYKQFPFEDD
ncbi:MAG: hypothetical protein II882_08415 [Lachnospiraceae bacterium]|nr:hypothetical protein [Lachnospiraceae bacterium]